MNPFITAAICFGCIFLTPAYAEDPPKTGAKESVHPASDISQELDHIEKQADDLKVKAISSSTHKLIPGDVIEIKVYQEEELYTRARVDSDGSVAMPLLGLIKLNNQTVEQAQKTVRDLLAKDYLKSPEVSLSVIEFAKQRFSIVGEVNHPGFYMFPEGERVSLLDAVAMAGGLTPFARSGKVTIKRIKEGKETILEANIKAMAQNPKTSIMEIRPGDAILIHQKVF